MARPSFTARLVNPPFHDPGLLITFQHQRRAMLFDLGDIHALSPRDLLKVSHVFVTHTHMDHFVGFDLLLRVCLGRDKEVHLFGPVGFFERVEGKLAGYTWNLVGEYPYNLQVRVTEVDDGRSRTRLYLCKDRFLRQGDEEGAPFTRTLVKEAAFRVEAAVLDHRIPCLGLSLIEEFCVNIDKEALKAMGLPVGPWLTSFKKAVVEKKDPNQVFSVVWEEEGQVPREKAFPLGELAGKIARISPGQKVTYLTDLLGSPENIEQAVELARDADHLFVEAAFLERDRETAKTKCHLTAKEAGALARKARVKQITLFHFSPRYSDLEEEIRREAMEAFGKRIGREYHLFDYVGAPDAEKVIGAVPVVNKAPGKRRESLRSDNLSSGADLGLEFVISLPLNQPERNPRCALKENTPEASFALTSHAVVKEID